MNMDITVLFQALKKRGVSLKLEGESLKVQAPKGALTKELQQQLMKNKAAILDSLSGSKPEYDALPQCIPDVENLYNSFPLSDLQLGFYMGDKTFMEFHVRPHYYLENNHIDLDIARYEAAWNKALKRHAKEINVVKADGTLQVEKDLAALPVTINDFTGLDKAGVEAGLTAIREDMERSELPIEHWPWLDLRISVWEESGQQNSRIHYNHNNFFSDGYGTTRLMQEVDKYYADSHFVLPEISLSFRDAAVALDELAESEQGQISRRYWESRLPNLPGPPELPMKTGMNRRCRSKLERRINHLSAESWGNIKTYAKSHGLTPSNAVFAAYVEVIAAWSNSRHFVLSNMMTRRLNIHPEINDIIGNFASLYPLEVDLRKDKTFAKRAQRLQTQVMRDAENLLWGGMRVMQALNRQNDSMGVAPIPFVVGSGLFMENFKPADYSCLETSQVMLDHQFWELEDGSYYFVWDLLEAFFPDGMIDAMWQAYHDLLEYLASDEKAWGDDYFELCPQAQLTQRRELTIFNEPTAALRLDDLLANTVTQAPDSIAFSNGNESMTYQGLTAGAELIAQQLIAADIHRGDRIAVATTRNSDLLQAVFGVLKVGGVYIPVDTGLPEERRRYILENSAAKLVLAEPQYASLDYWPGVEQVIAIGSDAKTNQYAVIEDNLDTDLAYIIYTSGSTGKPKGVMIDHQGAVNTILDVNARFDVNANDVIFGVSSFGFDLSVYDIFGAAASGATLVYPQANQVMNPSHWLDLMQSQHVTVWNSAPPLMQLLVDAAENRAMILPDLRLVMMSGDWIPLDLPARIRHIAPNAQVISLGGATEASIWSIIYPIEQVKSEWNSIPYGYPMLNQPWFILDELGRSVPDWTTGDLYIGGIGLAKGYWNDEEKTAASFVKHPVTGEIIYRTGDLGRYTSDGYIEFLGRSDSQVKIQGHRIELGEIESVLVTHPNVNNAVVLVQKDSPTEQGQLAVYLVLEESIVGSRVAENSFDNLSLFTELQRYLGTKLPDYMVPKLFLVLARFPITSNGKLDRKSLPMITDDHNVTVIERREAQGQTELALLSLWKKVLKIDAISATDNFFDIGGQSFEAVRLVGMIQNTLDIVLSPADIWRDNTIEKLAIFMDSNLENVSKHFVNIDNDGTETPLILVHPAGGHILCYSQFAKQLNRPVFAFQAPGINGDQTPLASISDFVDCYISELEQLDWRGPIHIGGWSSGGPIAFELANRLQDSAWDVQGVFVIDSPAPLIHGSVEDITMFNWFASDLELIQGGLASFEQFNISVLSDRQRFEKLVSLLQNDALDTRQLSDIYQVFKGMVIATRTYHPAKINHDILVIRATAGLVNEFSTHPFADRGDWGWAEFTSGVVTSEDIAGTHYSVLQAGLVQQLALHFDTWATSKNSVTFN